MPIFKPAGGYRDPLKAMTIKALEQRKALAEAAAAKATEMPAEIRSPWQGAAHLTNVLGTSLAQSRTDSALAERQAGESKLMGEIDPHTGATQEQIAAMGGYDPEVMKALFSDRSAYLRRAQWDAMSPEERAAAGVPEGVFAQRESESGKIDTANPPSAGVSIINAPENKGEQKWEEVGSTNLGNLLSTYSDAGSNAKMRVAQVDLLDKIMPVMLSGTEAQISEYMRNNWGITLAPGAGDATTAFNSIVNSLVPEQRQPGSGTMSDRDVELFKSFLPSMMSSPQANKMITAYLRGIAQYQQQKGALAQQALAAPDRRTAMKIFDEGMSKLVNPLAGLEETMTKLGLEQSAAPGATSTEIDKILEEAAKP